MKKPVDIRPENPEDYIVIRQINDQAFEQTDEGILIDKLRSSDAFIPELSLVAAIENKLVGHILFTRIKIEGAKKLINALALAPMAVLPDHQGQGIGSRLVQAGLVSAKSLGFEAVIVLGHEKYYPRFGFEPASKWNIRAPFSVPDPVFMALELEKGVLDGVEGIVEYAAPFMEL